MLLRLKLTMVRKLEFYWNQLIENNPISNSNRIEIYSNLQSKNSNQFRQISSQIIRRSTCYSLADHSLGFDRELRALDRRKEKSSSYWNSFGYYTFNLIANIEMQDYS